MKAVKVVLVILLGWMALRYFSSTPTKTGEDGNSVASSSAPAYSATVLSITCSPNYGRARAEIAIKNTGASIPYAAAFVRFDNGEVVDSYFRPSTVPVGAMAKATVYAAGAADGCQLSGVQDGKGNPVALTQ